MKKIYSYAMLLMAGTLALTSCSDDNDSNPTIAQPTEFVLNTPADANGAIDLAKSAAVTLTWSQPVPYTDFNAPVVPTYTVQFSTAGTFNSQYDADAEDNTGADFIALDETYASGQNAQVSTSVINGALLKLHPDWDETNIPSTVTISVRVKAAVRDASFREYNPILSNVVTLKVIPFYTVLKPAEPEVWYMTGGIIADGSWSNDPEKIGTGMTPFYVKPGFEYDKNGKGEIEYAGYFPEGEFKIIAPEGLSNWNYGLCGGTEEGGQVYRDGGDDPGNIKITAAGYYKLTLNTATHELSWETLDGASSYTQIAMPGNYQSGDGWDVNSNLLNAVTTGSENHDWFTTVSFDGDAELKFAANGGWDYNWGDTAFPYGTGTQGGPNIPAVKGNYKVYFNDILGTYMFVSQE